MTRGSEARLRWRLRALRCGPPRWRSAHPASKASGAPGRNTRDRVRARRARRSRSRDVRRGSGRTCRRRSRCASLVSRPFAPLELQGADADRVAFLRAERAQLAFDPAADQLALEVGRGVRRSPVDARCEALHSITLDPEGRTLAFDMPIARSSGERDAPLTRGRRARRLARRTTIEDLAKEAAGALSRRP